MEDKATRQCRRHEEARDAEGAEGKGCGEGIYPSSLKMGLGRSQKNSVSDLK